jgi:glycerol-1-phosphate dehydrogenase [NAD(P)+]
MTYAGVSRPASGVEHYFSHVWDMRGLEFGTPVDLHGIQCAQATLVSAKLYEAVRAMTPNKEKAEAFVKDFNYDDWSKTLRTFLGRSAETMIALEEKEGKYRKDSHPARFEIIQNNWDQIVQIIEEEIPSFAFLSDLLDTIGITKELDMDKEILKTSFLATKDIRDKYVLSRLAWDLGISDQLCDLL